MVSDFEYKKLCWHSRRGMLELDVLLIPFSEEVFPSLEEEDKQHYIKLLTSEDPDLFEWFNQRSVPEDKDLAKIVRIILDRVQPV